MKVECCLCLNAVAPKLFLVSWLKISIFFQECHIFEVWNWLQEYGLNKDRDALEILDIHQIVIFVLNSSFRFRLLSCNFPDCIVPFIWNSDAKKLGQVLQNWSFHYIHKLNKLPKKNTKYHYFWEKGGNHSKILHSERNVWTLS